MSTARTRAAARKPRPKRAPSKIAFDATVTWAGTDPETKVYIVALGEARDGSGMTLQLQRRAPPFNDEDRRNGFDTYCVVSDDVVHFGGVTSHAVRDGLLEIRLDRNAARAFDAAGFSIRFPARSTARISRGMDRVLREPTPRAPARRVSKTATRAVRGRSRA